MQTDQQMNATCYEPFISTTTTTTDTIHTAIGLWRPKPAICTPMSQVAIERPVTPGHIKPALPITSFGETLFIKY